MTSSPEPQTPLATARKAPTPAYIQVERGDPEAVISELLSHSPEGKPPILVEETSRTKGGLTPSESRQVHMVVAVPSEFPLGKFDRALSGVDGSGQVSLQILRGDYEERAASASSDVRFGQPILTTAKTPVTPLSLE